MARMAKTPGPGVGLQLVAIISPLNKFSLFNT